VPVTASHPAVSLRRSLLRRLVAPLVMLALVSGLTAFLLAWHDTERSVDHALFQYAGAVAQQIRVAGPNGEDMARQLSATMLSDPTDALYYRIIVNANEIAGRSDIPLSGTSPHKTAQGMIFESVIDGSAARIAQVQLVRADGSHVLVEVGQLDSRRYAIAAEFLFSIMAPLLLLLVAGWIVVVRAISQQINPLIGLADTLNQQTHNSLEPVDESHVPAEIRPLTSALNALLERLKTALEGQRTFIADAAHQLRTPLTAVKLHAEQAATSSDPKVVQSAVREVRAAADRAVRLSNQLLSLARAEPGEHAANFLCVDLAALTFETGAEWVPRALSRDVDMGFQRHDVLTLISGRPLIEQDSALDLNPHASGVSESGGAAPDNRATLPSELDYEQGSGSALHVSGNPVLLREAIANLIDNALKYAVPQGAEGSRITLSIGRTPLAAEQDSRAGTQRHVDLIIEDNGPGVPAELQRDLFKRFFRGDASTSLTGGSTTGAGLGLAIVRNIAVLHRGEILYESAEGGGSRFVIRLPLLDAAQVAQLKAINPPRTKNGTHY
jgi:signal transduction histidine kinase